MYYEALDNWLSRPANRVVGVPISHKENADELCFIEKVSNSTFNHDTVIFTNPFSFGDKYPDEDYMSKYSSFHENYQLISEANMAAVAMLAILENLDKFNNIKHLFLTDITQRCSEVSYIRAANEFFILEKLPQLKSFGIRAGSDRMKHPCVHDNLEYIEIQTVNLQDSFVDWLEEDTLIPNLKSLIIHPAANRDWFSSFEENEYGFWTKDTLAQFLNKSKYKLNEVGLCNIEWDLDIQDIIVKAKMPMKILDLSCSTINSEELDALMKLREFDKVICNYTYVEKDKLDNPNKVIIEKTRDYPVRKDWRYTMHAE